MARVRVYIEHSFERLSHGLYRHPLKVLGIVFLLTLTLSSQLPKISVDTSTEGMLRPDDPVLLEYNRFQEQFGHEEIIIIAVRTPETLDAAFLSTLKSLHNDLENEVPHLKDVYSLMNATSIHNQGDMLIIEPLLKDWPEKRIELSSLKSFLLKNKRHRNIIISEDGYLTAILIKTEDRFGPANGVKNISDTTGDKLPAPATEPGKGRYLSEKQNREVVEALHRVINRYHSPDYPIALSGVPVMLEFYNACVLKDMVHCGALSGLVGLFFLIILFRRVSGVLLPLLIIVLTISSAFGLMAFFQVPITLVTTVLPDFLLVVCVGDAVHILAIFYRRLHQGYGKKNAIAYAMGHSGLPIAITSLTTAAGLLSFYFAELGVVAELGIFGAVGVFLALLYTIVLLPPLVALLPIKIKTSPAAEKKTILMDRVLLWFAKFSGAHPRKIVAAGLLMTVLSLALIFRIQLSFNVTEYFSDDLSAKRDLVLIDNHFRGTVTLELLVDTKQDKGIFDPEVLKRIETLSDSIETIRMEDVFVGKVFSVIDIIKELNMVLNGNDTAHYRIPGDRAALAQEFLLLETLGSDILESLVDDRFRKIRVTIRTPWVDAAVYLKLMEDLNKCFLLLFDDRADISITGTAAIVAETFPATLRSMVKSYAIALLVISVLMICIIGNLKIGLISMIPNLVPIALTVGIIGLARIPVDFTIMMIGSIALGLVVDDTVHFFYNFRKYYEQTKDARQAISISLLGTGRALLITSLILSSGCFVLMTATLKCIVSFGFLTGMTILMALMADFLLAPALLILVTREKR